MTTNTGKCLETTIVSALMCINAIFPLPTLVIIFVMLCLAWVWLPDNIEIRN